MFYFGVILAMASIPFFTLGIFLCFFKTNRSDNMSVIFTGCNLLLISILIIYKSS